MSAEQASAFFVFACGALAQSLGFAALFAAATLPSGFAWLAFGVGLRRWLSSPQRMRAFNLAMGALLAASVILFVLQKKTARREPGG